MQWSNDDAKEWSKVVSMPAFQKGLKLIAKKVRPKRTAGAVAQGFDLSPVFIKSAGFYEGSQEVMDWIELLAQGELKSGNKSYELPEPFSHISLEDLQPKTK